MNGEIKKNVDMDDLKKKVIRAALAMSRQCWEQGILSYAMTGEEDEHSVLHVMVHDMVIRQSADGRLCNLEDTPAVTDSAFCIPAVWAGRENPNYEKAVKKNISFFLKDAERSKDGILFHIRGTKEIWADSAAFLPWILILTGHEKEGLRQLYGIMECLKRADGLYAHVYDAGSGRYPDPNAWGVGNGWILTGILRCANAVSREKERLQLKDEFTSLLDCILSFKTKNHLFHEVINDEETFEESEVSLMVAYSIYAAVNLEWLDGIYVKQADDIRSSIVTRVDEDGLIHGASGSPSFSAPGTSTECQAHFLLMEQERMKITHF